MSARQILLDLLDTEFSVNTPDATDLTTERIRSALVIVLDDAVEQKLRRELAALRTSFASCSDCGKKRASSGVSP